MYIYSINLKIRKSMYLIYDILSNLYREKTKMYVVGYTNKSDRQQTGDWFTILPYWLLVFCWKSISSNIINHAFSLIFSTPMVVIDIMDFEKKNYFYALWFVCQTLGISVIEHILRAVSQWLISSFFLYQRLNWLEIRLMFQSHI